MSNEKKMQLTRIQGIIAIASFSAGVLIACVCLFFIEPLGQIDTSAVSIVSELLILCGAILGVKASYDVKVGDRLEIALGNRTLAVEVLQIAETVKKDDACAMYKEV